MCLWARLRHAHILELLGFVTESYGWVSLVAPWQANGTAKEFVRGKSLKILLNVVGDGIDVP